jgi:hypothetical protein
MLLAAGCSTSSLFVAYPKQINPLLQDLRAGRPAATGKRLDGKVDGTDRVLYLMERGRLAQVQGSGEASMADYRAAIEGVEAQAQEADMTVRGGVAQAGALVVNDNVLPYRVAGFEAVLLHHFQALNYLLAGDAQGAAVEVRRAELEQRLALQRHEKEIAKAKSDAGRRHMDLGDADQRVARAYAGLDEVAGTVKDSFQNPATFFLSGVVYEVVGQPNDAYIDYKKALEIVPANATLQQNVLRLAQELGMGDEFDQFRARFPTAASAAPTTGGGSLVVIGDDEFVPQKEQLKIPIPIISAGRYCGLVALAFPFYETRWTNPVPFSVEANGVRCGTTQMVCSTRALAVKALKERLPAMLVRQALRAGAKGVAAKELTDNFGGGAAIAMSLVNYLSEQADLRSWCSLPDNVQVARFALSAGTAKVGVSHGQAGPAATIAVPIAAGGITVIYVKRAGGTLYLQQAAFGPGGRLLQSTG